MHTVEFTSHKLSTQVPARRSSVLRKEQDDPGEGLLTRRREAKGHRSVRKPMAMGNAACARLQMFAVPQRRVLPAEFAPLVPKVRQQRESLFPRAYV